MSRIVRTAAGAAWFGVPIGTFISTDEEVRLQKRARSVGLAPPPEFAATPREEDGEIVETTLEGPVSIVVGGKTFNVPEGTKVMKSPTNSSLMYIMVPGGGIHLLTPRGEAVIPENLMDSIRAKFEEAQEDADTSTSNEVLIDLDGKKQFVRRSDGEWEHIELGIVVSSSDMKKVIKEGELEEEDSEESESKADSK